MLKKLFLNLWIIDLKSSYQDRSACLVTGAKLRLEKSCRLNISKDHHSHVVIVKTGCIYLICQLLPLLQVTKLMFSKVS